MCFGNVRVSGLALSLGPNFDTKSAISGWDYIAYIDPITQLVHILSTLKWWKTKSTRVQLIGCLITCKFECYSHAVYMFWMHFPRRLWILNAILAPFIYFEWYCHTAYIFWMVLTGCLYILNAILFFLFVYYRFLRREMIIMIHISFFTSLFLASVMLFLINTIFTYQNLINPKRTSSTKDNVSLIPYLKRNTYSIIIVWTWNYITWY